MGWWRGSERRAHPFLSPVNDGKEKADKKTVQTACLTSPWGILPLDRGGTSEDRGVALCPQPSSIRSLRKRREKKPNAPLASSLGTEVFSRTEEGKESGGTEPPAGCRPYSQSQTPKLKMRRGPRGGFQRQQQGTLATNETHGPRNTVARAGVRV